MGARGGGALKEERSLERGGEVEGEQFRVGLGGEFRFGFGLEGEAGDPAGEVRPEGVNLVPGCGWQGREFRGGDGGEAKPVLVAGDCAEMADEPLKAGKIRFGFSFDLGEAGVETQAVAVKDGGEQLGAAGEVVMQAGSGEADVCGEIAHGVPVRPADLDESLGSVEDFFAG